MTLRDNTDAELDTFDTVCRRLGGFDPRVATEWADGYLTALAAGPRSVPADEWLPRLAGDAFERTFADPEDAAMAQQALSARARVLANHLDAEALLDEPERLRLQPLVSMWDEASRQALVDEQGARADEAAALHTGALWADGFLGALIDFAADWAHPPRADDDALQVFNDLLAQVQVLLLPPDEPPYAEHLRRFWPGAEPPPDRDQLLDEACFAVQELRVWWLDHAPRPATRQVAPQPGRNDPCPCGSGLKFKKCHGKGG